MSRRPLSPAERKAAQRARQKAAGLVKIELHIPSAVAAALQEVGGILGSSMTTEAEILLAHVARRHCEQAKELASRAGQAWIKAAPYWPYMQFLRAKGDEYRIGQRMLSYEVWKPIQDELQAIFGFLARRGWSQAQALKFCRLSAAAVRERREPGAAWEAAASPKG